MKRSLKCEKSRKVHMNVDIRRVQEDCLPAKTRGGMYAYSLFLGSKYHSFLGLDEVSLQLNREIFRVGKQSSHVETE